MIVVAGLEVVLLLVVALTVFAIIDVARRPRSDWERSGQNQIVWALVVLFVSVIGPVAYLLVGRPKLRNLSTGRLET